MYLKSLSVSGFKSFGKKGELTFESPITGIVGPNGSGKSNVAESFRFVLGEQSMKTLRGKKGEDMIWNGSPALPRANRASITITFDNRSRFLNTDFDEVIIERVVNRDGANEYKINGSSVRLRDVTELLAGANIGASGHHIISQGEADRVLSANPKERREMIEDALGLRVYQYKKRESERKLEKTEDNKKQVEALRKENAPHLRFLERQIEKLKKTEALRLELAEKYLVYLRQEEILITYARESIRAEAEPLAKHEAALELELESAREVLKQAEKNDKNSEGALALEKELTDIRKVRDTLTREIGRIEGEVGALKRQIGSREGGRAIPFDDIHTFFESVEAEFEKALNAEHTSDIKEILTGVRDRLHTFIRTYTKESHHDVSVPIATLEEEKETLTKKEEGLWKREEEILEQISHWRESRSAEQEKARQAERDMFQILTKQGDIRSQLTALKGKQDLLRRREEAFQTQVREGVGLIGHRIREYRQIDLKTATGDVLTSQKIIEEGDTASEVRLRELEKLKIRVEESGGGSGEDIVKEYTDAKDRDEFLQKELSDLEHSANQLKQVIADLTTTLDQEFRTGVQKITTEFDRFFKTMFGAGTAGLTLLVPQKRKKKSALFEDPDMDEMQDEEEELDTREGVEVTITLPHKRIKGLEMLSGGERALTSIALIFAMSQVNPPPFIILDETDAALDEANSRRYGDMISELGKKSQLILITHNRETMGRAGVLYGVTMGADGVSKLLSVKFEDAIKVAK